MKRLFFAIAWVAALAGGAHAETVRAIVHRGNEAYAAGDFAKAIAAYDEAAVSAPEDARILFDKGAACYRQEDYDKAKEAFEQAAVKTKDLALEAQCNFNLGNLAFKQAERQRDSDLKKAVESLQNATKQYQRALELDPTMQDAARNIEVARLTMKLILDEIQKQQEQQQQQQQMKQELEKILQEQQALRGRTDEAARAGQPGQELAEPQGKLADRTNSLSQQMAQQAAAQQQAQQPQQPGGSQPQAPAMLPPSAPQQALDQAVVKQREAKDQLSASAPQQAVPPQDEAIAKLKEALDAMNQQSQDQQQKQDQKQQQDQGQQQDQPQGQQNQEGEAGEGEQQKQQPQQAQQQPGQEGENAQPQQQEQPQAGEGEDSQTAGALQDTPEKVLDEEQENRDRRMQRPAGQQNVDKDW